jgi:hypothetical protein
VFTKLYNKGTNRLHTQIFRGPVYGSQPTQCTISISSARRHQLRTSLYIPVLRIRHRNANVTLQEAIPRQMQTIHQRKVPIERDAETASKPCIPIRTCVYAIVYRERWYLLQIGTRLVVDVAEDLENLASGGRGCVEGAVYVWAVERC